MYRTVIERLEEWKGSASRKPLLLQGARQVGKTWVINEFGRTSFERVAYVNFMGNETMKEAFEGDLVPARLLQSVSIETGVAVDAANPQNSTLVVFDEIQECPRAIMALKAFAEQMPQLPLIAAGSLLGVALHAGVSFPVGKVDLLMMYPMTFYEYLLATDESLAPVLNNRDYKLMDTFADRFIGALKSYYFVGGMPEAVQTFKDTGDYGQVRNVQNRLLYGYEHDFSKYADPLLSEKIRMLWASVPSQLGKENKKFVYSAVRKGARARGYEEAIQWLIDAGLVLKVNRVSKPGIPLRSYEDKDAFKLYMFDVGLLGAASDLSAQTLLEGSALFTEFKGALSENYVCQQLVASGEMTPSYWSAEKSDGEVDFLYGYEGRVVPVEVKAETNLRAKSLKSFMGKYEIGKGIRLSLAGFEKQERIVNIPLYAADVLPGWE